MRLDKSCTWYSRVGSDLDEIYHITEQIKKNNFVNYLVPPTHCNPTYIDLPSSLQSIENTARFQTLPND